MMLDHVVSSSRSSRPVAASCDARAADRVGSGVTTHSRDWVVNHQWWLADGTTDPIQRCIYS